MRYLDNQQSRQSVILYVSTLLGILMGFLASVVNTNFLAADAYGDVRYVQNIIQMLSWILLFGYFFSGSRMLARSDKEERSREIRGGLVMILAVCSLLMLLAIGIIAWFYDGSVRRLLFLSLPVCFYPLLLNYVNTVFQGDNHIVRLCLARVLPALLYILSSYCIYSACGVTSGMMMLLQWGIYSVILILIIASTRPAFTNRCNVFAQLQSENKSYGIQLYYGSLAMVATNYLPGVMLGLFNCDNSIVAFYNLALTLTLPLAYLPGIVGTAFFKKFTGQNRIPDKVMRVTVLLTAATCVMFVLLIHPVVSLFYPEEYSCVARYASYMSVGFCIHGVGDMLNRYLGSHGEGVSIRNSSFICGFVKISGFILLVWLWDIKGALITNVLASTAYCVSLIYYYRRFVSR